MAEFIADPTVGINGRHEASYPRSRDESHQDLEDISSSAVYYSGLLTRINLHRVQLCLNFPGKDTRIAGSFQYCS
jgi:hypothetical protein